MQEAYSHREGVGGMGRGLGLKSGNYRKTERREEKKEYKQVRENSGACTAEKGRKIQLRHSVPGSLSSFVKLEMNPARERKHAVRTQQLRIWSQRLP